MKAKIKEIEMEMALKGVGVNRQGLNSIGYKDSWRIEFERRGTQFLVSKTDTFSPRFLHPLEQINMLLWEHELGSDTGSRLFILDADLDYGFVWGKPTIGMMDNHTLMFTVHPLLRPYVGRNKGDENNNRS